MAIANVQKNTEKLGFSNENFQNELWCEHTVEPSFSMLQWVEETAGKANFPANTEVLIEEISLLTNSNPRARETRGRDIKVELRRARLLLTQLVRAGITVESASLLNEERGDEIESSIYKLSDIPCQRGAAILSITTQLLSGKTVTARRRAYLEHSLDKCLLQDDWVVDLFAYIDQSIESQKHLAALKHLFQYACQLRPTLVDWFSLLRDMPNRENTLKTLIRSLAFYLSLRALPIYGSQLASVIDDLRRLNLLLALNAYSCDIALYLTLPASSSSTVLAFLIKLLEQLWPNIPWFMELLFSLGSFQATERPFITKLKEDITILPAQYFHHREHKLRLEKLLVSYLHLTDG